MRVMVSAEYVQPEIELSLVLPCYNASALLPRHLPVLLDYLLSLGVSHEIILSDDGSRDSKKTFKLAKENGCRYVGSARNEGKGAAVRRGMSMARGKFCLFTDADIPYECDVIKRMLFSLDQEGYDFVAGNRHLKESVYFAQVPLIRTWGSHIYSYLSATFMTSGVYDTQCGIKGFRAIAAQHIFDLARINRFAFDVELFRIAVKYGYKIQRLPVRLRCQEESSVKLMRDGLTMFKDLAAIQWHEFAGHYESMKSDEQLPHNLSPGRQPTEGKLPR